MCEGWLPAHDMLSPSESCQALLAMRCGRAVLLRRTPLVSGLAARWNLRYLVSLCLFPAAAFASVTATAMWDSHRAVAKQSCLLLPGNRDGPPEGVQGAVLGRHEAELHGVRSSQE